MSWHMGMRAIWFMSHLILIRDSPQLSLPGCLVEAVTVLDGLVLVVQRVLLHDFRHLRQQYPVLALDGGKPLCTSNRKGDCQATMTKPGLQPR